MRPVGRGYRALVLDVRQVTELHVDAPLHAGRPAYVASASGLVRRGGLLYVVADDEPALAVFDRDCTRPGTLLALDPEPLPVAHAERKAEKPDLESLMLLPATHEWPDGALLTLGSGSTDRRERGWLWTLDGDELTGPAVELSLSSLYDALRGELPELNIEGAAIAAGRLWLAQRGNGAQGFNALVELSLDDAVRSLADDATITPGAVCGVQRVDVGSVEGWELTFSDLAPLADDRLLFCAVAEAVESTYLDGPCVGAAVGVLDARRQQIARVVELPEPHKIEGVTVDALARDVVELLLVADADVTDKPAPLLAASLSCR